MYEFFEHTADLGLAVESRTLEALFRDAAEGLMAMIVDPPPRRGTPRELELRIEGQREDHLLFDLLSELLYLFETQHVVPEVLEVEFDARGLQARARGWAFDPASPTVLREVKAITYHELCVEPVSDGWRARVIVDI